MLSSYPSPRCQWNMKENINLKQAPAASLLLSSAPLLLLHLSSFPRLCCSSPSPPAVAPDPSPSPAPFCLLLLPSLHCCSFRLSLGCSLHPSSLNIICYCSFSESTAATTLYCCWSSSCAPIGGLFLPTLPSLSSHATIHGLAPPRLRRRPRSPRRLRPDPPPRDPDPPLSLIHGAMASASFGRPVAAVHNLCRALCACSPLLLKIETRGLWCCSGFRQDRTRQVPFGFVKTLMYNYTR